MADPAPGTLSQEQIALRWNQQIHLQPSSGRTSPRKLLRTAVWVILVLALSLYATRATRASQIQASYQAALSYSPNSTSPSTAFLTLAPLANSPTLTITEPTASAMTASKPAVATPFPPEPSCFPFCDIVMNLQPVPNSTSSDVAWQHASVLHPTSHLSHSIAADHASKASHELPTAAADTQGVTGQNSSTGQLVRQAKPPVNFANWWWSVPIISVLCTVLLVETSWALARLLASICIAKVKEDDDDFYKYVRMHCLCLVILLHKFLCHIQVHTPPPAPPATDVPCAETQS